MVISGRKRDTRGPIGMQRLVWWCVGVWRGVLLGGGGGGRAGSDGGRNGSRNSEMADKKEGSETKPAGGAED